MATDSTVRVRGLPELQRALRETERDLAKELRAELRGAGDLVRGEAKALFERYSPRSAAGYRVRVRQRGVAVEQSLKRTTGRRPDFGELQLAVALVPALEGKEQEVVERVEHALDRVAERF